MNLKDIKRMVSCGNAEDITKLSSDMIDYYEIFESGFEVMAVSYGTYGMNGALLKGYTTGGLYVITARNSTLFRLV